jgi:hypothetical protein
LPDQTTRIVVTHHPFEGASADDDDDVVGRSSMAMQIFSQRRVDVILELCGNLGDEVDQAAFWGFISVTSIPSWNLAPAISFGN